MEKQPEVGKGRRGGGRGNGTVEKGSEERPAPVRYSNIRSQQPVPASNVNMDQQAQPNTQKKRYSTQREQTREQPQVCIQTIG